MFKPILVFFLIAFQCNDLFAQAYKDSIELQFLRYTESLMQKDFARSTDYMNPGFFKFVPKEQLISLMSQAFNNPDMDFKIEDPKIVSIGSSKTISKQSFVKLQYSNYLSMQFKNSDKSNAELTNQALQGQFGENNVKYDSATNTYKIFVVKNVIANSADNKNWTFVVVEEKQKPLLEKFIPKEML